jgi:murein DD-endopeptidase MepM/ murein hydrolase activator NlpD
MGEAACQGTAYTSGGVYGLSLKHGDDFFSVYVHLSKVFVTNGQHIKRG